MSCDGRFAGDHSAGLVAPEYRKRAKPAAKRKGDKEPMPPAIAAE